MVTIGTRKTTAEVSVILEKLKKANVESSIFADGDISLEEAKKLIDLDKTKDQSGLEWVTDADFNALKTKFSKAPISKKEFYTLVTEFSGKFVGTFFTKKTEGWPTKPSPTGTPTQTPTPAQPQTPPSPKEDPNFITTKTTVCKNPSGAINIENTVQADGKRTEAQMASAGNVSIAGLPTNVVCTTTIRVEKKPVNADKKQEEKPLPPPAPQLSAGATPNSVPQSLSTLPKGTKFDQNTGTVTLPPGSNHHIVIPNEIDGILVRKVIAPHTQDTNGHYKCEASDIIVPPGVILEICVVSIKI